MLKNLTRQYGTEGIFILALLVSVMLSVYVTVAVCLSIIIYMFANKKFSDVFRTVRRSVIYGIAVFCVMALVVAIAHSNQTGIYVALGVSVVVITGMFLRRYMTRELFETGISLCCWLSVGCFVVALFQLLVYGESSYRVPSTFMNANYYAMVIEFVVTLCLYKILSARKGAAGHVLRYCLIILVNIAGLYISGCRTGFIVTLSVFLLMFLLYKRYSLFWTALCVLAVYAIVGLQYFDIMPRDLSIDNDLDKRLSIWITALKGIAMHPVFGGGGNAYSNIYAIFDGHKAIHAHNLILDVLLNYGIVGFVLVFVCFIGMFKSMRKGAAGTCDAQIRYAVYTVFWCVLIHGLMDVTIFWIQTSIIFLFIFSGSCAQTSRFYRTPESHLAGGFDGPGLRQTERHMHLTRRTASRH